ncbi:hypothetical protein LTS08_005328 [Lithohypha guttulata]|nr:hypothetical protein LTS08_005328 [Lithohypha guttulata]
MCGIYCCISARGHCELDPEDARILGRRGPDALTTHKTTITTDTHVWHLTFTASVLALRGAQVQVQPIVDQPSGSILCWNGEAWNFDGQPVPDNDTHFISTILFEACKHSSDVEGDVLKVLSKISGPYAFVFYDAKSLKLYFGRDALGRRSLTVDDRCDNDANLTIASVVGKSIGTTAQEIKTAQVYLLDLKQPQLALTALRYETFSPRINKAVPIQPISLSDTPSTQAVSNLVDKLTTSLQLRVQGIPTYTAINDSEDPAKVAILFSGGLDCTLIARLCHELLPKDQPIDLLNVAFENPRVVNARSSSKIASRCASDVDAYEACPDRLTGRSSFAELVKVCSERQWRFVAINIPYEDFLEHRSNIIQLMYPHNTEMDLSITAALYFAARGQGSVATPGDDTFYKPYTTTARVLLSGLGADELFGGYARHAAAFTRAGYEGLNDELEIDFMRIGTRNLGRDDRVISHWGKETRYPFLDEKFVEFALSLPAWGKCGFRTGNPVPKHFEIAPAARAIEDLHPEKMLLRCAMWHLGMKGAAAEKKRAIQFGARTAKMIGGKTKGTDIVSVD